MNRLALILVVLLSSLGVLAQSPEFVVPAPVRPGAKIALITPASAIDSSVVVTAMERIRQRGYEPVPMPHVFGHAFGSYTAPDSARAADVMQAFADPEIEAILCTRGGYGSARLLPYLDPAMIMANPKWLIGFSDITALHGYLNRSGLATIHGPMCGHIASEPIDDESTDYLFTLIANGLPMSYTVAAHEHNNPGRAEGRMVGGNVLVAHGLAETDADPMHMPGAIIFLEDVGEKIYAIERWLVRMHQSGILDQASALVFGQFTNYTGDEDYQSMEQMLSQLLRQWGYYDRGLPIVFDFPAGHVSKNYPLPFGTRCVLNATADGVTVDFLPEE